MDIHNEADRPASAVEDGVLDTLAVAPPPPDDEEDGSRPTTDIRDGLDAGDVKGLRHNPSDEDAKLEVALDETFPSSDAPSNTQPGKGKDPAPSSGYDADAETERADNG